MSKAQGEYDFIIIGAGVSASFLASQIPKGARSLMISSPLLLPPSSFAAGALVSTYGAQKGMSPLGDIICESFDEFKNWASEQGEMNGLTAVDIEYFTPNNLDSKNIEKFKHRWNQKNIENDDYFLRVKDLGFIIEPNTFLDDLKSKSKNIKTHDGFVSSINSFEKSIALSNGVLFTFNKLIIASGAYHFLHQEMILKENLKKQKISFGSYLISTQENLGDLPFAYNFNNMNVIYNTQKELIIGATTQDESHFIADLSYFEKALNEVRDLFQKIGHEIPSFKNKHIKSGIRSKGPKRMPTMEWINDDIFVCHHLYKNGFLFSPLAAKKFSARLG